MSELLSVGLWGIKRLCSFCGRKHTIQDVKGCWERRMTAFTFRSITDFTSLRLWYIYALVDPRDGKARYVGLTRDLARRLKQHRKNTLLAGWFWDLGQLGLQSQLVILDWVTEGWAKQVEQDLIHCLYKEGHPLLNISGLAPIRKGNL